MKMLPQSRYFGLQLTHLGSEYTKKVAFVLKLSLSSWTCGTSCSASAGSETRQTLLGYWSIRYTYRRLKSNLTTPRCRAVLEIRLYLLTLIPKRYWHN